VGMMFADVCRSQKADAEITFVAGIAAEWSYEENAVKNVFEQPSSSGPVDGVAAAVGQGNDLLWIDMAHFSRSGWVP
jgi:hypothetical protein